MDNFEKAVTVSLNELWGIIEADVNDSEHGLAGRSGSSIAEDVILEVMESRTVQEMSDLATKINLALEQSNNTYRFVGFRYRPTDGNVEAHSRSIEDVILILSKDGEELDAYINIKVSNGKKGQADNSCSWKAGAYALFGDINISRRSTFLKYKGEFTSKEHHNYFFWVLLKDESDSTVLSHGHVNSLLSLNPKVNLRFNINQPFPVQVVHSHTDDVLGHTKRSMKERRSILHSWLTLNMTEKYIGLLGEVHQALDSNITHYNLYAYEKEELELKMLAAEASARVVEAKRMQITFNLTQQGVIFDEICIENEDVVVYKDKVVINRILLAEIKGVAPLPVVKAKRLSKK